MEEGVTGWEGGAVGNGHDAVTYKLALSCHPSHLSTAMATKVKMEEETDMPCARPLILQMLLLKGQPRREQVSRATSWTSAVPRQAVLSHCLH